MDNGASSYRRFLDGDDNGLVEIIRDYKDGLMLYINSFVRNIDTAEELAEETFVKIVIKKPKYNEKSSFKTWLYAIGRNAALDHLRHKRKNDLQAEEFQNEDEESLEKSYIRKEDKLLIHKAIKKLKPEYRQVLWLTYFEDFSNKETAKLMKKSIHNIETLIYRARKALKTELEKEGFTYEDI